MRQLQIFVALVAAFVAAPTALSTWGIQGAVEPDTPQDSAGGFLFNDPDTSTGGGLGKVYFSGVAMMTSGQGGGATVNYGAGGINPNVVPLGTRLAPLGTMQALAYLGVWKDCDGDGYVGTATSALWRYRSELLLDAAVCPAGSAHNLEGWVTEFRWIHHAVQGTVIGGIEDREAEVWGDFGTPGAPPHLDCRQVPIPHGTLGSTGGMLGYVDCQLGFRVFTAVNAVDNDGSLGLAFDDPMHPERDCDSTLNQQSPWGNPYRCDDESPAFYEQNTGDPAFSTWDCSSEPIVVRDPTSPSGPGMLQPIYIVANKVTLFTPDGGLTMVRYPAPAVYSTDGSFYDGANQSVGTIRDPCAGGGATGTQPSSYGLAAIESPYGQSAGTDGKRQTDLPMNFWYSGYTQDSNLETARRAPTPVNSACTARGLPRCVDPGATAPLDALNGTDGHLGVHALTDSQGSGWRAQIIHRAPSYYGNTLRSDLGPAEPLWLTFYARVGANTSAVASLPSVHRGVYGAEACGGQSEGIHGEWDCDAGNWWRVDLGGRAPPIQSLPLPGVSYDLRDVDCLDGSIADGVQVGLTSLSSEPACPA